MYVAHVYTALPAHRAPHKAFLITADIVLEIRNYVNVSFSTGPKFAHITE